MYCDKCQGENCSVGKDDRAALSSQTTITEGPRVESRKGCPGGTRTSGHHSLVQQLGPIDT